MGGFDFRRLADLAEKLDQAEAGPPPIDAAAILDFLEVPSGDAFDVPPEQAIAYFNSKGLKPTFSYAEMLDYQHDASFTVAKMMNVDMLAQVRASLDAAMANGTTFKEWSKGIMPILQSGGWWGKKEVVDPLTGQKIVAQLGSPWRLETIFRTNMQTAYAAGAWQEIVANKEDAPFLMYDAIDDQRTRPLHASWDRKVLPVDSPWWGSHYPPNGYNCRCGVIQLTADEVQAMGLTVTRDAPDDGTYKWTNPRTDEVHHIPKGIDPGFEHNAGIAHGWTLKELEAEKVKALQSDMAAAARKQNQQAAADGMAAAVKAQQQAASAAAQAALARSQAKVAEKALQWDAQQQLTAIGKGKESAGAGAAYKVKALAESKKSPAWLELKPSEQLQQVLTTAAELKAKADLSKGLSLYKTQILAGKNPSPAAVKAFKSLPEAEAASFLKKVDDEFAALAAKEAATKAAEEAAAKAANASTLPATGQSKTKPPNPATLTKIGEQKGSNPGGTYQDTETGVKWYIKQPASADIARNEVLAGKLYELAGLDVPEMHVITLDGKPSIASRIVDGLSKGDSAALAAAPGTAEGFAVDAWLANWDVVGMGLDNLLLRGSKAFRVDTGGALRYRAQGTLKGSAFGDTVTEIDSLRDPSVNRQTQSVFGRMTAQQIEDSVVRVLKIDDADIVQALDEVGPLDTREKAALLLRLQNRRADLAKRYPAAAERARAELGRAEEPPKAAPRVTAAEQKAVEDSRVNGYSFATDSDQVEDNMVLVHAFRRTTGADATRGFFKLLPQASNELQKAIAALAGDSPTVSLATARQAILDAVKSIGFRASKGEALDSKVVARIEAALKAAGDAVNELSAASTKASGPEFDRIIEQADLLQDWAARLNSILPQARAGAKAKAFDVMFPAAKIPDAVGYTVKAAPGAPAGPKWKKVEGQYSYTTAKFERSFATETAGRDGVAGVGLRYEAELPDGTKVIFFPNDSNVAFAMQGVLKIDVPGRGVQSTGRVFEAMQDIGLKSVRATEIDRQHLYLNAFSNLRLIRSAFKGEFDAITERGAEGVTKKLALIKRATGLDVQNSEGWKTIDGVRQAFGHGRAYQHRPDLDAASMRDLDRTHVLYHNPQGLGTDAGSGVFDRLKVLIDGGGMFAPLTDRVRRGVALSGSSVSSDLASGGGDYHFTRIRARADQAGKSGVYWKTSALKRMDAITYNSDQFGRTTAGHVEKNRQGQTVDSFRSAASSSGNETIFKGGLSVFDDLDRIVLSSQAEVNDAVAWLKTRGYQAWPDGRALTEVIITKAAHAKR